MGKGFFVLEVRFCLQIDYLFEKSATLPFLRCLGPDILFEMSATMLSAICKNPFLEGADTFSESPTALLEVFQIPDSTPVLYYIRHLVGYNYMLYQVLLSIVLYLGTTCQPLVISHDSASVSTVDKAINSTCISQQSSQQHYKYLVIDYVQQYINPLVASWIEPTCPLGSHPGLYPSVLLYSTNLTCPLGSHPALHQCDHLSTISLYKGCKCAHSPQ